MKTAFVLLAIIAAVVVVYVFILKPLLKPAAPPVDPLGDAIGGVAGAAGGLVHEVIDLHKDAFHAIASAPGAISSGVTSVVGTVGHAIGSLFGGGGTSTPYPTAVPSTPEALAGLQKLRDAGVTSTDRAMGLYHVPILQLSWNKQKTGAVL